MWSQEQNIGTYSMREASWPTEGTSRDILNLSIWGFKAFPQQKALRGPCESHQACAGDLVHCSITVLVPASGLFALQSYFRVTRLGTTYFSVSYLSWDCKLRKIFNVGRFCFCFLQK